MMIASKQIKHRRYKVLHQTEMSNLSYTHHYTCIVCHRHPSLLSVLTIVIIFLTPSFLTQTIMKNYTKKKEKTNPKTPSCNGTGHTLYTGCKFFKMAASDAPCCLIGLGEVVLL